MVERIVKLGTELEPDVLPDLRGLEEAQVQLVDRYRSSVVTRHITERVAKDPGRARAVENKPDIVLSDGDNGAGSVQCVE